MFLLGLRMLPWHPVLELAVTREEKVEKAAKARKLRALAKGTHSTEESKNALALARKIEVAAGLEWLGNDRHRVIGPKLRPPTTRAAAAAHQARSRPSKPLQQVKPPWEALVPLCVIALALLIFICGYLTAGAFL